MVKDILAKSQKDGKKNRLCTIKDLDAAALQLAIACRVLLNPTTEDDQVREEVWQRLTPEELSSAIDNVEDNEFTHLNESFAKVKDLSTSMCAVLIAQGCNIGSNIFRRSS